MERQLTLKEYLSEEFTSKYGDISGELWRLRKSDGRVYRILTTEYLFSGGPVLYVSHDLDNTPLSNLYAQREQLLVSVKDNNSCVIYKDTWENVHLFSSNQSVPNHASKIEDNLKFIQSKDDIEKLQKYISCGLFYFAHGLMSKSFDKANINSLLSDYKSYLGLHDIPDATILNLGSLECTEKIYRIAVGTIYGTWEMRYFFYVLYLQSKNGNLEREEIMKKGDFLGYSETTIIDYIKQMKVVLESSDSSLWDFSIVEFKLGVTKPYHRVPTRSVASFAYSIEDCSVEDNSEVNSEGTDWSGYETRDYWNIEDEYMRDAFDDDIEAYGAYLG